MICQSMKIFWLQNKKLPLNRTYEKHLIDFLPATLERSTHIFTGSYAIGLLEVDPQVEQLLHQPHQTKIDISKPRPLGPDILEIRGGNI